MQGHYFYGSIEKLAAIEVMKKEETEVKFNEI